MTEHFNPPSALKYVPNVSASGTGGAPPVSPELQAKMLDMWLEKTEWVQQTSQPHELGRHRADVLRDRIEAQAAEIAELKSWKAAEDAHHHKLRAEIERLREALVAEREENLWNAYATGDVRGDEWTHLFMSDGEWLAKECGFDPRQGYYSAEAIRNAIPIAARAALGETE